VRKSTSQDDASYDTNETPAAKRMMMFHLVMGAASLQNGTVLLPMEE
jgi:hypothetical protein